VGGGLAILIRSDLSYSELTLQPFLPSALEVQGVKILLKNNASFSIINLYNPNKAIPTSEYEHYFNQVEPSSVIVGDFNAHGPQWEPGHTPNVAGRNLSYFLLRHPGFALVTSPALPTYLMFIKTLFLLWTSLLFPLTCNQYPQSQPWQILEVTTIQFSPQ
jgi:hypothetical protein